MINWITEQGSLGILVERIAVNILLEADANTETVTYKIIAGELPRGLRLVNGAITGSPVEVKTFSTSRFVIRASTPTSVADRTFSLSVDGSDIPAWITKEGFLNVGKGKSYFILDNSAVNFQLEASDTDTSANDILEFYLLPNGGQLPPGLTLSKAGVISGFTDPIFALEYSLTAMQPNTGNSTAVTLLNSIRQNSNGYDTFLYDTLFYDYNEPSIVPRRLSRIYTFAAAVTDGINTETRIFKIYVVTEEFLQADNNILEVSTSVFQADNSSFRSPIWITNSNLGIARANNYLTVFLDVFNPPTLTGTITYFLLPTNPDSTVSELPPGMALDSVTGEIAGRVPYQSRVSKTYTFTMNAVYFPAALAYTEYNLRGDWNANINYLVNDTVRYQGILYICIEPHRYKFPTNSDFWSASTSSTEKTFTIEIIGEIDSAIAWITDSDLGVIKPNQPSIKVVEAESLLSKKSIFYKLVDGALPPGLEILPNGIIRGKVKQFADDQGAGITRFFIDGNIDGNKNFNIAFDGGETSFNQKFNFKIQARDSANFATTERVFSLMVSTDSIKTFANLYVRALQSKEKRLSWYNFITNSDIFNSTDLYRYGDTNFGIQPDLKVLIFAGIESVDAVNYITAMSRNHYNKRLLFGNVLSSVAKDPNTQETIYEVVYVSIVDEYEKNKKSISRQVNLPTDVDSKLLTSYDIIKIDSDIPLVSDSDYQKVYPNSIKNMRKQIHDVGERDREFLPLWMRSIQGQSTSETGYVQVLPLCYCKPGRATTVMAKIKASNFDFKSIDFTIDRYIIDTIDGRIKEQYLKFPQRNILNKY
jgi:hypothetical protein